MKIVDINNNPIPAAFQFVVQNSLISVSTIMDKRVPSIAVFNKYNNSLEKDGFNTVQEAISWVHSFGNRD